MSPVNSMTQKSLEGCKKLIG